ncbi:MAG: hypothetical protein O2955_06320 [Planctomycetota bacterium]|nr:hypothetical protein [Pseudomonadota bacterium]MDA1212110.1 hypothetical protein [Planctomycetota bacterium]
MHTTKDVAKMHGIETWRVRRLFEDGTLPEPPKLGAYRMIPDEMIPAIREALERRGWLRGDVAGSKR